MANTCGFNTCGFNIPSSTEAGPAITADAFTLTMRQCGLLVDWVISPFQSVFLKAISSVYTTTVPHLVLFLYIHNANI
jgi:hypothetical protein